MSIFNFFKSKKKIDFNVLSTILSIILQNLQNNYSYLYKQFEAELIVGISSAQKDLSINYIGLIHNPRVAKMYENQNKNYFKLTGIKLRGDSTGEIISVSLFVYNGLLIGIASDKKLSEQEHYTYVENPNLQRIALGETDYNRIAGLLTTEELKYINKSDVYLVEVGGKNFFHIRDVEDGNFLALDSYKNIFLVKHDPVSVEQINSQLINVLKPQ